VYIVSVPISILLERTPCTRTALSVLAMAVYEVCVCVNVWRVQQDSDLPGRWRRPQFEETELQSRRQSFVYEVLWHPGLYWTDEWDIARLQPWQRSQHHYIGVSVLCGIKKICGPHEHQICGRNMVQNCLKPATPSHSTGDRTHGWCHSVGNQTVEVTKPNRNR